MKKRNTPGEWASLLDQQFYESLEPINDSKKRPSPEQMKMLALKKIREKPKKEMLSMKKIRVLLVAAILVMVFGVTALALGGLDYFRGMFGDSVDNVADKVFMPSVTAQGPDGYLMTAQAVLSDGYQSNVVFSTEYPKNVENLDAKTINTGTENEGFQATVEGAKNMSISFTELAEYHSGNRLYFMLTMISQESCAGKELVISKGETRLQIPLNGEVAVKTIDLGKNVGEGRTIDTVQLSPMGILISVTEEEAKGSLPIIPIQVIMTDGSREDATVEFDQADDGTTVRGGGGVVIGGPGQAMPLVVMRSGHRNPDGKFIAVGTFSRLLDMSKVKGLCVNATEYALP